MAAVELDIEEMRLMCGLAVSDYTFRREGLRGPPMQGGGGIIEDEFVLG